MGRLAFMHFLFLVLFLDAPPHALLPSPLPFSVFGDEAQVGKVVKLMVRGIKR